VTALGWTINLTGKEGTQIQYKYTLGAWDFVDKGTTCDETRNRQWLAAGERRSAQLA
jgi:hypothetical protein